MNINDLRHLRYWWFVLCRLVTAFMPVVLTTRKLSFIERQTTSWPYYRNCNLQLQSPASYGSVPHTCKRSRPKVGSKDSVETDGGNCITSQATVVGNKLTTVNMIFKTRSNKTVQAVHFAAAWSNTCIGARIRDWLLSTIRPSEIISSIIMCTRSMFNNSC